MRHFAPNNGAECPSANPLYFHFLDSLIPSNPYVARVSTEYLSLGILLEL
jgi:hypothetical protein